MKICIKLLQKLTPLKIKWLLWWVVFKYRYLLVISLQMSSNSIGEFQESQEKLFIGLHRVHHGCLLPYWNTV